MRAIINQIIVAITYCVFILSTTNSYAAIENCTSLPTFNSTTYLVENTAYGYIQQNAYMKSTTEGIDFCNSSNDEFKFCILKSGQCDPITKAYEDKFKLKDISSASDLGGNEFLENIILSVQVVENKMCLTMPTSQGIMPIICRDTTLEAAEDPESEQEKVCRVIAESCYGGGVKSQSLLSFSGLTVHCLRDSLDKMMYLGNECAFEESVNFSALNPFSAFQASMKNAVLAALSLYIMFYGFKLVMNIEYAEFNKIAMFVIKFIFVLYFAVGIGTKTLENGEQVPQNGMTEMALPLLVEMTSTFANIVFSAGGSQGLCVFDIDKYEDGYSFYRLWDSIDCRVGYYLGMQAIYNMDTIVRTANSKAPKSLKQSGGFAFFIVMGAFLFGGNILMVAAGIVFGIVFLSIIMYFITSYLVCMITLYVMAYISPIFIPMILFERTKSYFDSWLKIVVSCTLQPAIIGAFIALLLTMYDSAIYGNCEFKRHDYTQGNQLYSTFELVVPDVKANNCTKSAGYKLLKYYEGKGWKKKNFVLFSLTTLKDSLDLFPSLLYVMIYVLIFYYFVESVAQFASDVTSGPSLQSVTVKISSLRDQALSNIRGMRDQAAKSAYGSAKGAASSINKRLGG